jgi:uncharacterized coiled-coil protein SlyX
MRVRLAIAICIMALVFASTKTTDKYMVALSVAIGAIVIYGYAIGDLLFDKRMLALDIRHRDRQIADLNRMMSENRIGHNYEADRLKGQIKQLEEKLKASELSADKCERYERDIKEILAIASNSAPCPTPPSTGN